MPETKDVKALLTDAIKKRDDLNTFIKLLQEMSGTALPSSESSPDGSQQQQQSLPAGEVSDPMTVVYPGLFWGKSQTQATKLLLERVRRPLKTKMILDCLKTGGLEVGGKNPSTNLWSVLNRATDTFVLVPKAGWDLIERYDAAVIAKMRKEGTKENGEDEKPQDEKQKD